MPVSRVVLGIQLALLCFGVAGSLADTAPEKTAERDFTKLDLSGEWYVLIHYKDKRSEDESLTKFKDFAWSVQQTEDRLVWVKYPYVLFDEELELVRRHAMTEHLPWEPDEVGWKSIREAIEVSSRAMTRKRLSGSVEEGFKSLSSLSAGGMNTLTFSRNWDVSFGESKVRIEIVDALSGTEGLAGMEEASVFEIQEQVASDELRGRWREETRHGTFRMVRTRERRVVK
jgi:hypothetical protein